jgi:hypothetical protein
MSLQTYLRKRGLTLDVLDYQNYLANNPFKKAKRNKAKIDDSEPNPLAISKVYDKWLSNQPKEVTNNLPKHWTK